LGQKELLRRGPGAGRTCHLKSAERSALRLKPKEKGTTRKM
jgi:hypothetical protein